MKKQAKKLTKELGISEERKNDLEEITRYCITCTGKMSETLKLASSITDLTDLEKVLIGYAIGNSNNNIKK